MNRLGFREVKMCCDFRMQTPGGIVFEIAIVGTGLSWRDSRSEDRDRDTTDEDVH